MLFLFCILCALELVRLASSNEPVITTLLGATNNNYLRCGEIYTCSAATFRYKPTSVITRPERCVWIIAVPGALMYSIKLEYPNDYRPSNTADFFKNRGFVVTRILFDSDLFESTPLFSSEIPFEFTANVLVLTFYSEKSDTLSLSRDIIVSFQAHQKFHPEAKIVAEFSEYTLLLPDNVPFRHPKNSNLPYTPILGSVELSIIALLPRNNFHDSSGNVKIVYNRLAEGMDIGCTYQSVSVYSFKRVAENFGFRHKGTFCEDITSFSQVTSDVTLVLVTSIRNATDFRRGFQLTFVD